MRTAVLLVSCTAAVAIAACGADTPNATKSGGPTLLARSGATLMAVDTGSGKVRRSPAGAHDADWSAVYTARAGDTTTTVTATDPATGEKLREIEIEDRWAIPIAAGATPEGAVSGDGRWLVLAAPEAERISEFALLDTALTAPPNRFRLEGRYEFDALSPDGTAIYLSQIEADGRYAVRAFDVSERRLRPQVIVEKTSLGSIMQGVPVARAVDPTGAPVHTLYRGGPEGAFVHSLDTARGTAICILIPRSDDAGSRWRLRLGDDATELHAVDDDRRVRHLINPHTGEVADAPMDAEMPGTRLGRFELAGGTVTSGARPVAEVGAEAELLAVR